MQAGCCHAHGFRYGAACFGSAAGDCRAVNHDVVAQRACEGCAVGIGCGHREGNRTREGIVHKGGADRRDRRGRGLRLYVLESGQAANIVAVVCAVFPIVAYQSGLRRGGIYHPQAKFVVCRGVFIDGGPIDNARFHVAAGGLLPSFDCGYVDSANLGGCARTLVDRIEFARLADGVYHAVLVAGNGHHALGQCGNRVHFIAVVYGRVHLDASEDVEGVCRYLIVEDAVN